VVAFDSQASKVAEFSKADETEGKPGVSLEKQGLMHLVLENDEATVGEGRLVSEALNHGFSSFVADELFEKLVREYSMTQQLYGEKLIRMLSGYSSSYLRKNLVIPEFRRALRSELRERFEKLKEDGYIDRQGNLTRKSVELASLVLYFDELEHLLSKGLIGSKINKRASIYGDKNIVREYKKGDRYRDIEMKQSVRMAIRRLHKRLEEKDLRVFQRQSKGSVELIYAIDASGSMKGRKIEMAKRAGVALAYTAIKQKDKVGLLFFGSKVRETVEPSTNFTYLIEKIVSVMASSETNISGTIQKSVEMFSNDRVTKHLILLTDCLPTFGKEPEKETLDAAAYASSKGVTISLVGINLDKCGMELAEQIVQVGRGRLYVAERLQELDVIILRDYYSVA